MSLQIVNVIFDLQAAHVHVKDLRGIISGYHPIVNARCEVTREAVLARGKLGLSHALLLEGAVEGLQRWIQLRQEIVSCTNWKAFDCLGLPLLLRLLLPKLYNSIPILIEGVLLDFVRIYIEHVCQPP